VNLRAGTVYEVELTDQDHKVEIRATHVISPVVREEPATKLGDKWEKSYSVEVLSIDRRRSPARFDLYASGLLTLTMRDLRYAATGDPFDALNEIRKQMEVDGRIPLVNGANRNACITGMIYQFGEGAAIYLVEPDGKGSEALIVDPLAADHVTDPVSLSVQEEFQLHFWKDS